MSSPNIAIAVEAGDWPPEAALEELARRAIGAAVEALTRGDARAVPHPSQTGEGDHAKHGGGGGSKGRVRHSPPPPRSAVPLPRDAGEEPAGELSIVFTDDAKMRKLNEKWRGKDSSTNVLSFPQGGGPFLGDVILSAETVAREASLADKRLEDHMAHLLIHGYLHLLGFDHETEHDAAKMEQLERVALKIMGIDDPYAAAS